MRPRHLATRFPSMKGGEPLTYFVLAFVSVTLLVAIVALVRERRLRRALQQILHRLLIYLHRRPNVEAQNRDGPDPHAGCDSERLHAEQ
jgi:hypothetical protein